MQGPMPSSSRHLRLCSAIIPSGRPRDDSGSGPIAVTISACSASSTRSQVFEDAYAALFRSAEALRAENLFLRRLLALYIERGLPPHRVDDQQRLSVDWIPARSRPRAKKNERPFTRPHCTRVWITVGPFPAALASDVHRARAAAQPSLDLAQVDLRLRLLILEGRGATQLVRLEKLVRLTPSVAGG
jgi:hypothetical protein